MTEFRGYRSIKMNVALRIRLNALVFLKAEWLLSVGYWLE